MIKQLTEELPITVLLFNYNVSAFASNLHGPEANAFHVRLPHS